MLEEQVATAEAAKAEANAKKKVLASQAAVEGTGKVTPPANNLDKAIAEASTLEELQALEEQLRR